MSFKIISGSTEIGRVVFEPAKSIVAVDAKKPAYHIAGVAMVDMQEVDCATTAVRGLLANCADSALGGQHLVVLLKRDAEEAFEVPSPLMNVRTLAAPFSERFWVRVVSLLQDQIVARFAQSTSAHCVFRAFNELVERLSFTAFFAGFVRIYARIFWSSHTRNYLTVYAVKQGV